MIYRWCQACKNGNGVDAKSCRSCGAVLGTKYRVIVKSKGKRHSRLVDSLSMARQIETTIKADLLRNEFNIKDHQVKKVITLDTVWKKYLPHAKESKKTWKNDEYLYESHIKKVFGAFELVDITTFRLEKFKRSFKGRMNRRGKPFTSATTKHYLILLRRLFNMAIRWDMFTGPNPVNKIEMPKLDNEIVRYLTDEQLSSLHAVLDVWPVKQSANFIRFLLYTGLRRGEAFKLEWNHVDIDQGTIKIVAPKGGKTTTLPLNQMALDVLKSIDRKESPFVFPGKKGGMLTDVSCWDRIKGMANLPEEFRLHDLRHNFASGLVSNGVDLFTVSKLLTHKDPSTTRRYAHLSDAALRSASEKAGALFERKNIAEK